MTNLYTIVDRDDNVISYKPKSEVTDLDILRVAGVLIYNSDNEVLLAKRSQLKKRNAGKWGTSAAGGVEKNETYEQNIIKELEEELGIKIDSDKLIHGKKYLVDDNYPFYYQQFYLHLDLNLDNFKLEPNEVAEVKWFTLQELNESVKNNPDLFIIKTYEIVEDLFKNYRV